MVGNISSVRRKLAENLKRVRDGIGEACAKARRKPSDITLVAVSKEVEIDIIRQSVDLGLLDLGENRAHQLGQRAAMLHEFVTRRQVLDPHTERPRPRWHMIGHLQRNKVKLVLPWAELIHSVDSLRLGEEISLQATKVNRVAHILLEVNTSGERSKFGVAVGAVSHIAEQFRELPGIRLRGLMTMSPLDATPDEIRLYFDRLREVFDEQRESGLVGGDFDRLSMGMSNDFQIAIAAGANMLRIGRALYEGLSTATAAHAEDDG